MTNEQWTPRVGDRVRSMHYGLGFISVVNARGVGVKFDDGIAMGHELSTLTLIKAASPLPSPAYVKQTRPDVPYDVLTPFQQTGRIG